MLSEERLKFTSHNISKPRHLCLLSYQQNLIRYIKIYFGLGEPPINIDLLSEHNSKEIDVHAAATVNPPHSKEEVVTLSGNFVNINCGKKYNFSDKSLRARVRVCAACSFVCTCESVCACVCAPVHVHILK